MRVDKIRYLFCGVCLTPHAALPTFRSMGDFAAGKILDPISVLLQLIEQKAPDLHAALQPVPAATADALTAAPVALHPFLAVHDGGWEIYDYVLCPCAQMTKHDAGLAIANHKFDEGDKLCLDLATAACIRSACAAPARGMCMRVCSAWHVHARVQRMACACAPLDGHLLAPGRSQRASEDAAARLRPGERLPSGLSPPFAHGRHASHCFSADSRPRARWCT